MRQLSIIAAAALSAVAIADRTIFITPSRSNPDVQDDPCLSNAFYGRYGRPLQDVYIAPSSCAIKAAGLRDSGSMAYLSEDDNALVWLQDAMVDDSLRTNSSKESFVLKVSALVGNLNEPQAQMALARMADRGSQQQTALNAPSDRPSTLYHLSSTSALISVPVSRLPIIDAFLPRFVVPVMLPSQPLANLPVDPHAVQRLRSVLQGLQFNPSISAIVSGLDKEGMYKDIRWLTGEADSGILSRHSFSSGARVAADWIQGEIEKSGAVCEQRYFRVGFAPNVICRYPAKHNTTATTILSAHYDSRGSFGSLRAPGGDDDGSGTVHVLAIARVIKEKRIAFKNHLELVLFAGEEQGLVGSRAYSHELREASANVTLHIQADMLAYRSPEEPLQLGLPDLIGLPEATFLVANMSKIYAPELAVGYTSACCSDHQSFVEQGFPATQVFERAGPIIDPMYHNSGDISNRTGYDFDQVLSIAKVTLATVLETAGFEYVPVE